MLIVDPRAGSKELVQPLEARGLEVFEDTLEYGDVAFVGRGEGDAPVQVGVEVKKLPDLLQSMRTGRLEGHQLLGMRSTPPLYDFAYLLVEGIPLVENGQLMERYFHRGRPALRPIKGSFTAAELFKRLHVLQLRGGLTPIWSMSLDATVLQIEMLYRVWTDKPLDAHDSHIAIYNPPSLTPVSECRRTLNTLPGVGTKLSGVVADYFGHNLLRAFTASEDQWAAIPGLGPKSAATIVKHIRGEI